MNVNDTAGRLFDAQIRQAFDGASLADLGRILDSGQIVDAGARAILETMLAEEALAVARAPRSDMLVDEGQLEIVEDVEQEVVTEATWASASSSRRRRGG